MANTINDLYLKYVNKVGRTLEQDRYFQYLFEMVQAGENTLQNKAQVLHKVVDEKWLTVIEESLDAINTIIDKPRRFITNAEEVVPVALAKKITADSVRHLSMNTQFIASNEDGDIQPTRILNVTTEESYDLYENRFVYHLIQRLVTFIDKRTDVIFWATGDETRNTISYQSKVDDAYEEIEYKLEMTVKNRQSFAENDNDNMGVFMRIDRVRRMVMALKHSSFCDIMAGCAKVRSPIQRTNLIMKDPYYRTCYKLWQFLESYDDVGYSIEVQDSAVEFDEEYLFQMYTNLITNYTVFKSLLEDPRQLEKVANKKRRLIKPKFIKKVKEEIVQDYDIPDVEIRKVIIEEVTQAQLDAEEKLKEEIKAREEAEKNLEDMDDQMIDLQQQISTLLMKNQEAEIRAEQERIAKEDALEQLRISGEEKEEALRQAEETARELDAFKTHSQEEIEAVRAQGQEEIEAVKARSQEEIEAVRAQGQEEIEAVKTRSQEEIEAVRAQGQEEIEAVKARSQEEIEKVKAHSRLEVETIQNQAGREIETLKTRAGAELAEVQKLLSQTREDGENQRQAKEEALDELRLQKQAKEEALDELMLQRQESSSAIRRVEETEKELEAARRQADAVAEELEKFRQQTKDIIEELRGNAASQVSQLTEELRGLEQKASATEAARQELQGALDALHRQSEEARERFQETVDELAEQKEALKKELEDARREVTEAQQNAEDERVRADAEKARADAKTLSHYIVSALNERKKKSEKAGDDE